MKARAVALGSAVHQRVQESKARAQQGLRQLAEDVFARGVGGAGVGALIGYLCEHGAQMAHTAGGGGLGMQLCSLLGLLMLVDRPLSHGIGVATVRLDEESRNAPWFRRPDWVPNLLAEKERQAPSPQLVQDLGFGWNTVPLEPKEAAVVVQAADPEHRTIGPASQEALDRMTPVTPSKATLPAAQLAPLAGARRLVIEVPGNHAGERVLHVVNGLQASRAFAAEVPVFVVNGEPHVDTPHMLQMYSRNFPHTMGQQPTIQWIEREFQYHLTPITKPTDLETVDAAAMGVPEGFYGVPANATSHREITAIMSEGDTGFSAGTRFYRKQVAFETTHDANVRIRPATPLVVTQTRTHNRKGAFIAGAFGLFAARYLGSTSVLDPLSVQLAVALGFVGKKVGDVVMHYTSHEDPEKKREREIHEIIAALQERIEHEKDAA